MPIVLDRAGQSPCPLPMQRTRDGVARAALVMAAALALGAADTPTASAQPRCGRVGRPWVSVAFAGETWTAALREGVLADLRAGLALQGFDACPIGTTGSQPPLAMIQLSAHDPERVSVSIDVHDAITEKRIARDVDLASVTDDSRSLAVAVAADELLRASWAELALSDAPEPALQPPVEVEQTLRASLAPELTAQSSARLRLGARFAFEHHGGGIDLLGGDLHAAFWPSEAVGVGMSIGMRDGLAADTDNGRVQSRALTGSGEVEIALLSLDDRFWLWAAAGVGLATLQLEGETATGARSSESGAGLAAHGRAGLGAALAIAGPLELSAQLGLGVPLSSVEATDAERVVTSTGGLQLYGGLGVGVRP